MIVPVGRTAPGRFWMYGRPTGNYPETLELYRKRTSATVSVSLDLRSSLSIQPFEGSRFVRGGRYGISMDFGLEVVGRKSSCGATVNLELISFPRDATAPDGLIVPRDTSFFKTYCYLIASFGSSMSLASGTRKRPPQSGFVQTDISELISFYLWSGVPCDSGPRELSRVA